MQKSVIFVFTISDPFYTPSPWTRTWTQSSAIGACRQANHHEGTGTFVEVVNEEKVCRGRTLYLARAPIRSAQTWQQRAHDDVVIYHDEPNDRLAASVWVFSAHGKQIHNAQQRRRPSSNAPNNNHEQAAPHHTNDGPSGKNIVWIIRICRVGREFIAHHSSANPTQPNEIMIRDTTWGKVGDPEPNV